MKIENKRVLLRVNSVTKKFDNFTAVNNVSLEIYESEIFCLLGGSGCGKSTLLRMIAGFEDPTSGTIELDGQVINDLPSFERPVNMMFQSYALFPHMTVEENVAYGLKREKTPKAEIQQRVSEILAMVKLTHLKHRKPNQLSGGQQQRVALARALVKKPKLLLLDEPLGALDKKLREETQFELINLQETLGITFIVVTHDQEEAMILSNRLGVMNEGEIVQTGAPEEVYEFPNSRFVANFIGTINTSEGVLINDEADHAVVESKTIPDLKFFIPHGISAHTNQTVWAAVRPEKITLSRSAPKSKHPLGTNSCKGEVSGVAYMGGITLYQIKVGDFSFKVSSHNDTRDSDNIFDKGETVFLNWSDEAVVSLTI
ncbi:MAG: ABC transporter ATP-binding protein [Methylacidiphilales bacterium]|nr:ABC transporter ATP-binding protein [Candidatus Methylacidiphilales bacterium]